MGKRHRDNAKARKKIGQVAYDKKRKRRAFIPKCKICGNLAREHILKKGHGICPNCLDRIGIAKIF